MNMVEWHRQQEELDRGRVTALASRDDLDEATSRRRIKWWADHADWHADRAAYWERNPL